MAMQNKGKEFEPPVTRGVSRLAAACALSGLQWMMLPLAILLVTGCSDRLSGLYVDRDGVTTYEFRDDGQAVIFVLGARITAEYTIDGDKVLVTSPQGTIVLTRKGDQLLGPMGMELVPESGKPAGNYDKEEL